MTRNDAPVQGPRVEVPVDPDLATEPARTIADLFADRAMVRPLIAAVVAVVAAMTGWVAEGAVIENLTTIVTTVAIFYAAWSAQVDASRRAIEQGEETRRVAYAPATVERAVTEAAFAGTWDVEEVPEEEWGVNQTTGKPAPDGPSEP